MSGPSLYYWNEKVQSAQPRILTIQWTITAAVTATPTSRYPVLTMFGATTWATIDAFLGTSSEFTAAQFDATALGADAFGAVVNMGGQCAEVYGMRASCFSGTAGVDQVFRFVEDVSVLTDSSLSTEVAKGANGNIGLKVIWGNTPDFDGLTAGTMLLEILWRSK